MTTTAPSLPSWATLKAAEPRPVIDVDAHAAYPAVLAEYRELYADSAPPFMTPAEWKAAKKELEAETPSAYWLEVAYQAIKLDVIFAMKSHAITILIHDPGKVHAQAKAPQGRKPAKAAGGVSGGREARQHYQRLRGFIPNFG